VTVTPGPSVSGTVEALNWLVEFDTQRCEMDPALEAVEEAFNAVCMARAHHRILPRQPRVPRMGGKRLSNHTVGGEPR